MRLWSRHFSTFFAIGCAILLGAMLLPLKGETSGDHVEMTAILER